MEDMIGESKSYSALGRISSLVYPRLPLKIKCPALTTRGIYLAALQHYGRLATRSRRLMKPSDHVLLLPLLR